MDLMLLLIYIALIGALSFEGVNFILLIKLRKWSMTAGKNLISQVVNALNLKFAGHQEKIGEALTQETISKLAESIPQEAQEQISKQIDIPSLIQAFLSGQIKREDLVRYAPLLLNALKEGGENPQTSNSQGRW